MLAVPVADAGEFASGVKAEVTVSRLRVTPGAMVVWGSGRMADGALGRSASAGIAGGVGGRGGWVGRRRDGDGAGYRRWLFVTGNKQEADEQMWFFGLNRWSPYNMISTAKMYHFYLLSHIYCDTQLCDLAAAGGHFYYPF